MSVRNTQLENPVNVFIRIDGEAIVPMGQAKLASRRGTMLRCAACITGVWTGAMRSALAQAEAHGSSAKTDEEAEVRALAKAAGIGPLRSACSNHFLAIGDAPDAFLRSAVELCESLGETFLRHFEGLGFATVFPSSRMTVVALKDQQSYASLLGEAPGKDVGGHFDLDSNRLVIFDFRPSKDRKRGAAERTNLFTLVHETAHQLCYNAGILSRWGQWPLCVSEGLATYVEMWRPGVKNAIGGVNRPRIEAIRQATDWISIGDMLKDDAAFEPETEQLAYAESWLLVHYFLRATQRQARFRAFLGKMQGVDGKARPKPTTKVPDPVDLLRIAEQTLGDLHRIEKDIKDDARKYLRG